MVVGLAAGKDAPRLQASVSFSLPCPSYCLVFAGAPCPPSLEEEACLKQWEESKEGKRERWPNASEPGELCCNSPGLPRW